MSAEIPFTKDEFKAALEVQAKATEQMVIIAGALREITEELKVVHDRLANGAIKEIVSGVTENYNITHRETVRDLDAIITNQKNIVSKIETCQKCRIEDYVETLKNSPIAKDIEHVKWFIGIVGIIVIASTVIVRGLDSKIINDNQNKMMTHLLALHDPTILNELNKNQPK